MKILKNERKKTLKNDSSSYDIFNALRVIRCVIICKNMKNALKKLNTEK